MDKTNNGEFSQLQSKLDLKEEIIKYTPGGMHVCYLSDPIHLDYASDGLCYMLGYTREEFQIKTGDFYLTNVPEEDHHIFFDFILNLAENLGKETCEYRMICKDGTIITVSDTMESILCDDGVVRGYSSVTDITELKRVEKQLEDQKELYRSLYDKVRQSEERFRVISKFSGIMFYEYDIQKMDYTSLDNTEPVLLYSNEQLRNVIDEISEGHDEVPIWGMMYYLVHEKDKETARMGEEKLKETGHVQMELRILCGDYNYHWFSVEALLAENDQNIEMGCIRNVDDTKHELDVLKLKATLDPMTGLMNKVAAFAAIDQFLQENQDKTSAFIFFDLDDFKSINDNLGHTVGDQVLRYMADTMKMLFRNDDILVRFGGDEFIAFMKNVDCKETVIQRIVEFKKECRRCEALKDTECVLSASIGIAFSNANSNARKLCLEADKAAYMVKRNKKGGVYCEDIKELTQYFLDMY